MTGRVKGPEYDAECRSLIHQYEMSAQTIAGFDPFKFAQVSNPLLPIRVSGGRRVIGLWGKMRIQTLPRRLR